MAVVEDKAPWGLVRGIVGGKGDQFGDCCRWCGGDQIKSDIMGKVGDLTREEKQDCGQ